MGCSHGGQIGLGVGCSWQSDWLKGGSFTGSVTMRNGSTEWDGSSFSRCESGEDVLQVGLLSLYSLFLLFLSLSLSLRVFVSLMSFGSRMRTSVSFGS